MDDIPVSRFKAEALAIVERVSHGDQVTVTKRGVPVARLIPVSQPACLIGSVRFLVSDEELLAPAGAAWSAENRR